MPFAIEVEGLDVRYRGKNGRYATAVDGLSFRVAPGEVVGFLGPNGAGKSSTLKALMGFVEPSAGQCRIFGMSAGSKEARARAGYLPEVALYYPFLTPLETLTLYGELQGLRGNGLKAEAVQLLETVGLSGSMKRQNRTLSKGMLQRVGIAQALLGNPELLILDEVTSGLDPVGRQELRKILLDRRDRGATLFFSSHELAEVEMLCDRILLIHRGKLIEERSLGMLKEQLRQFVIVFAGGAPVAEMPQVVERTHDGHWRASFEDKEGLLGGLEAVHRAGAKVVDVVAQEGSLEDYFIETVRRAA